MTLALALALLIGSSLVLLGAGGSIVTIPVLVYAAGLDPHRAAGTSLVIVGLVALAGAIARWPLVSVRTAALFGALGMVSAWPGVWLNHRAPGAVVLVGFALTMLVVAARMTRAAEVASRQGRPGERMRPVVLSGLAVGLMTGFFGVGGGFLIVPALSLVLGLEMAEAVATSLLVIALNCAAGLLGHLQYGTVDWQIGASLSAAALLGGVMTLPLARRLSSTALQHAFAGVLAVVGAAMLIETLREVLA
ncbi:MAG TPA: sulfite exporter TauE/SafE family protein [Candidatus Limnocylindria bacterium]|nr:sulfite exporter TauE/SafE family protein [Candidatus Limnocylindria bacterium]